jgi:hypothetical protein
VLITRHPLSAQELRDWIVREVRRRHPEWSSFDVPLTIQRLPEPQRSGLTWRLGRVPQLAEWSAEMMEAFSDVLWDAQRRFDLRD